MTPMAAKVWLVGCVCVGISACGARGESAGQGRRVEWKRIAVDSIAADRVATQASAELRLTTGDENVTASEVFLEPGPPLPNLRTIRAWISRDHWHAYQLTSDSISINLAGGFESQNLDSIAAKIAWRLNSDDDYYGLSKRLAEIGDRNGAVSTIFPFTDTRFKARGQRQVVVGVGWPTDTVRRSLTGEISVNLTIVTQASRSFSQDWTPTAYVFQFDSRGRLTAWATRSGSPIAAATMAALIKSH